jgi:hypothetical protein
MNRKHFFCRPVVVCLVFCLLLLLVPLRVQINQSREFKATGYELTPQFFKFISFGFWPATVDLLWIKTLQAVGQANYSQDTQKETLQYYRISSELDPYFYETYDQAAIVFAFYYGESNPALQMIDRGIKVYEHQDDPRKRWTHPFSLYLYRAYVNAFMRNDWVQAKQDYLRAAYAKGSPEYLQKMKVWLKEEGSEKKLATRVLKVLIQSTEDPLIRSRYQEKLKQYE